MNKLATQLIGLILSLLCLTSCGGGGGSSTSVSSPTVTAITPSGSANIGATVTLSATATDPAGLPLTYSWDFGDGLASDTGATVYRIYSAANTYTVTLTVTNSGGASATRTLPLTIAATVASSNLVADCSGTNCAAASASGSNTYSGTGTGVWRFDNQTNAAVTRDINIQNVAAGKTVTLLFSNGQSSVAAATTPSLGVLAAPASATASAPSAIALQNAGTHHASERAAGESHHTQLLHANRALALDMVQRAAQASKVPKTAPAGTAIEPGTTSLPPAPSNVALGDVRLWNETFSSPISTYSTTAKVVCAAGTLGRKVVIWVQTSIYVPVSTITSNVTDAKLALYQSQFCGTNNNDGQYAKIANLLGDVWGTVPANASSYSISDAGGKQDINIIIVNPGTTATWGGYFYSLNNVLKTTATTYANSNEALAFFVNSRQSQNYTASVLIHELTHMINYYQRVILHNDTHESWLEDTSAMMTQDIFDPGLTLSSGCLPIVCELRDFGISGAGISYFNWPSTVSSAHYNLGASFAAFLNRKYGPVIYMQLMTDCYTPTTNTTSFACLDFLIKQNGGTGFADEFAKMGASVFGRIGGSAEPSQYGFPAKSGTITNVGNLSGAYSYSIPAFNNWWTSPSTITIPTATTLTTYPYTSQTYKIDTVAVGKTSYVRTGVSVPAKTSLITIIK